jgi:hypothetical protein
MILRLANIHTGEVMHVHHVPSNPLEETHDIVAWIAMTLGPFGVTVVALPETSSEGRYGIASGKRFPNDRPMSPFGSFLFNTFKQDH